MENMENDNVNEFLNSTWCRYCVNNVEGECKKGESMDLVQMIGSASDYDCPNLNFF